MKKERIAGQVFRLFFRSYDLDIWSGCDHTFFKDKRITTLSAERVSLNLKAQTDGISMLHYNE